MRERERERWREEGYSSLGFKRRGRAAEPYKCYKASKDNGPVLDFGGFRF